MIRAEKREDIDPISEVHTLAFERVNEAKLVEAIRSSEYFIPELSLAAVSGASNEVIGHIMFSEISIKTEEGLLPTIGLSPMAVHPEYQNRGIGSALVREGLKRCKEKGFEHVFVLGHPHFYPKFGFEPSNPKGIRPPFPVPDEVFMVCELKEGSLAPIFGTVEYPPAFNEV
ncbi:MAG: GNAT family N-acetyltransferase [Tuberibacillus sp.]